MLQALNPCSWSWLRVGNRFFDRVSDRSAWPESSMSQAGVRQACLTYGGESVLVNGAVFKTVSETVRTGSGRFDSYTPPPGGSKREAEAGSRRQRAGGE